MIHRHSEPSFVALPLPPCRSRTLLLLLPHGLASNGTLPDLARSITLHQLAVNVTPAHAPAHAPALGAIAAGSASNMVRGQ